MCHPRNNPLLYVDPDGKDFEKAKQDLKLFAKSLYIKVSIGVGYEAKLKAGTAEIKAGVAYKANLETSIDTSKVSRSAEAGASASVGPAKGGESISVDQTLVTTNGQNTTVAETPVVTRVDTIGGNTTVNSSSDQVGLGFETPLGPEPIVGGIEAGTTREGLDAAKDIPGQITDSLKNPGPPPAPKPPSPPACSTTQDKKCPY